MKRYLRVLIASGAALLVAAIAAVFVFVVLPDAGSTSDSPSQEIERYTSNNPDVDVVYLNEDDELVFSGDSETSSPENTESVDEGENATTGLISARSPSYEAVLNEAGDIIEIFDVAQPIEPVQVFDFSEFTPEVIEFGERYVAQMTWVAASTLAFTSPAYDEVSSQVYVLEVGEDEPVVQLDQNLQFLNSVVVEGDNYTVCHYSVVGFRCFSTETNSFVYEKQNAVFGGVVKDDSNQILFWAQDSENLIVNDGSEDILTVSIADPVHFFMSWDDKQFVGTQEGVFAVESDELVEVVRYREGFEPFLDSVRLNFDKGVVTEQHLSSEGTTESSIFSFSTERLNWVPSSTVTVW